MKKVSIIIPFKGQTEKDLAIVLGSINSQIGVDFSTFDVHLVNDGGDPIDMTKFEIFANLELHYHVLPENVGAGLARQYGIDHTDSEYFMFLDSDDEFHFAGALLEFYNVVKYHGEHQMIVARYIEEYKVGNEYRYLTHSQHDWKSPVAKWFSRAYINSINLRFRPELRIFEDTYFVGLACQLSTDIYYLNSVVYTWVCNPNSTVRSNGRIFEYQTHTWALENRLFLEKIREMRPKGVKGDLVNYVCDVYMRYTRYPPVDPVAFWTEHIKLLQEFKDDWDGYSESLQKQVNFLRDNPNGNWTGINTDGFKDFVNKVQV
ncbi:MAG: glycosyltransferase family 2 protein [Streptococcaceae bacterium]|jgi:glycosyltransferase involved in cell wall biosynthesis|nr:glycosyltransferase family 2 protein [Streptococcaceae bacterium]